MRVDSTAESGIDMTSSTADAALRFSFAHIGLLPDMGSHYVLSTMIGPARALELLLSGDAVSAEEAQRLGLVSKVLPTKEVADDLALTRAESFAKVPPEVLRQIKTTTRQVWHSTMADAMAREISMQTERFLDPAFAARIEAFLKERTRKPNARRKK